MSFPPALDARGLHNWANRTVGELSLRRDEINALNVFPVPDADTGSNMAHTMEAAVAEADKGGDVAEALAVGSVRGARGNSGMVLSQVLRGVADATVDSVVDGPVLAQALTLAVSLVDRAIAQPVEGTVITVLRAAADAATRATEIPGARLYDIAAAALEAARDALEKTPSQLPVLREAGVVDAGGTGLVIFLECLIAELEGAQVREGETELEKSPELEVVFFFEEGDLKELERQIASLGNSLVIARATEDSASVHIHTRRAGFLIETAFGLGKVSGLHLEVLPEVPEVAATVAPRRKIFVAAAPGPIAELFKSIGAILLEPGETLEASAVQDIFLPNGSDARCPGATVVPTDSLVAGLAAISVYEPDNPDTAAVVESMTDAAHSMRVGHPAEENEDEVISTCRRLLEGGGEQITILTSLPLDSSSLTQLLGVHVMVVSVPGAATEIGVE